MSLKNKDLLNAIADRFIKPKTEEIKFVEEKPAETKVATKTSSVSNKLALDVTKIGRDYYVIEIDYNLDTMEAKVVASNILDNKVVALSFGHGKSGIESIINRNKRFNKGTQHE